MLQILSPAVETKSDNSLFQLKIVIVIVIARDNKSSARILNIMGKNKCPKYSTDFKYIVMYAYDL